MWLLPVYSATEAKEEAADAVSQSRSVLLLGLRLRMGKASSDSTLQAEKDKVPQLYFSSTTMATHTIRATSIPSSATGPSCEGDGLAKGVIMSAE